MKKKILISGMSCQHCVKHVTTALEELSGVSKVEVDLAGNSAVIEAADDLTDDAIKTAIDEAGYEVIGVEAL